MEKKPQKDLDPYPTMWCWPPEWQQIPRFDGFQKKQWSCAFRPFAVAYQSPVLFRQHKQISAKKCVDNSEVIKSE